MARILVIDDDPKIREVLIAILSRSGHEVVEASNGRDGLSMLRANGVDLVITDLFMPEMDGIEVIQWLRQERPDLPAIAMSAGGVTDKALLLRMADALGAVSTIPKPFDPKAVIASVNKVLGQGETGSSE